MNDWTTTGHWLPPASLDGHATEATGRGEHAELCVDATLDSLPLVRTLAGAVAMRADYDIDAIADLKLVVDEICTMLIRRAFPGATLVCRFSVRPHSLGFEVSVAVAENTPIRPDSLSWRLLTALVDSIATTTRMTGGTPTLAIEVLMSRKSGVR